MLVRPSCRVLSLSSRHTLRQRSRVHNRTPVFSAGCLLRRVGRTDIQWSRIRFTRSEPRARWPQGGYIFYAGGSIAGVSCRRRWPRLLLLS